MLKKLLPLILCYFCLGSSWASTLPVLSGVGGDFSAIDQNNQSMKLSDYKGKVIVLAFGYTNCADIQLKGAFAVVSYHFEVKKMQFHH